MLYTYSSILPLYYKVVVILGNLKLVFFLREIKNSSKAFLTTCHPIVAFYKETSSCDFN